MQYLGCSVTAIIAATPHQIWQVVSDVTRHPELAGSGEVERVETVEPGPLHEGALFQANQNLRGVRYVTISRVVAWQPPTRFAWQVGPRWLPGVAQVWYFQLAPSGEGTQVTNGVVLPYPLPDMPPFSLLHDELARHEAAVIAPTLANLARLLGVAVPTAYDEVWRADPTIAALLPSPWLLPIGVGLALVSALALRSRVSTRR